MTDLCHRSRCLGHGTNKESEMTDWGAGMQKNPGDPDRQKIECKSVESPCSDENCLNKNISGFREVTTPLKLTTPVVCCPVSALPAEERD